jgi:outer membrane protein assembly factor BamE (lipoprotein component of BamABCDE complex)
VAVSAKKGVEMKTYACILITALALSACANPRSTTNQLELGMTKDQVRAIMGEPDSSAAIKGQGDCYYYSMWRDFWNRRPGDYSDRYYACFQNKKLVTYGRVGDPM